MDTHYRNGSRREWDREFFINIMVHELGHALGLPHLDPAISEIMSAKIGSNDNCKIRVAEKRICNLVDYDFERFLWPYKPQHAESREAHQARWKARMEAESRRCEMGCWSRGPGPKVWILPP